MQSEKDSRNIDTDMIPHASNMNEAACYRSPIRMFAVVMNMRRVAHSRRALASRLVTQDA
jgi:hypothetical protein